LGRGISPHRLGPALAREKSRRTARATDEIDGEATIAATIATGGEIITPVFKVTRNAPEYLILIARRSAADHDAARLRDLVTQLQSLLPIVVFYFVGEPSVVEPDRGGRAVSIDRLQARYGDYRLLILGSGSEFLDPTTLAPHESAAKLTLWSKRALLTPLPVAEWGREEFSLAHALNMPVGRATPEGLLALAEIFGLEDAASLVDPSGDGLARPLPEVLRVRPQQFLYNVPPSVMPVPQLIQDLRNFLDGPSFEWLCALAVYPAVQWDLTLYLGLELPERVGDEPRRRPLYREDRIAALTQLPWLQEGLMPNWLRRALIRELRPSRAAEVRVSLNRLLSLASLEDSPCEQAIKLRIARETVRDRLDPHELFEDDVLLDFLARGRIEDLALPSNGSWLERLIPRRWLDRFGIPELGAAAVAAAYAASAAVLAPRPSDGALLTGAWLPLFLLGIGAIFALAVANPDGAYRTGRSLVMRASAPALAFAFLTGLYDPLWAAMGRGQPFLLDPTLVSPELFSSVAGNAASFFIAGFICALTHRIRDRLGIPLRRRYSRLANLSVQIAEILVVSGLVNLTGEYMKLAGDNRWPLVPMAIGVIIFLGGLTTAWVLPDRLSGGCRYTTLIQIRG
jgi:hypothetical protein